MAQLSRLALRCWGTSWSPHLGQKGTARSSVYSGLSGSQRELFPSKMKRKQTLCQAEGVLGGSNWAALKEPAATVRSCPLPASFSRVPLTLTLTPPPKEGTPCHPDARLLGSLQETE
ncbi:unnamed protein product [Rangifer tarandus platyrhynchus]|uniref:Uncharacterized protein n=2 Tax=Rangifer tarandus platyrhynchus TaxID=3082113 RepID=A0ABN8Y3F1_RANTA|nr:unnamed protein product [Rangifer tarandus platyrhynchus]CAI9693226.1 unnamed protein product [Rangifer tarandus platyrhynchus]